MARWPKGNGRVTCGTRSEAIPQQSAGFFARRPKTFQLSEVFRKRRAILKVLAQVAPARRDLANRKPARRPLHSFPVAAFEPSLRTQRATTAERLDRLENTLINSE
ncbi:MAG: hypothetical protein ABI881_11830 [Betaproteobacteria bacterium]